MAKYVLKFVGENVYVGKGDFRGGVPVTTHQTKARRYRSWNAAKKSSAWAMALTDLKSRPVRLIPSTLPLP